MKEFSEGIYLENSRKKWLMKNIRALFEKEVRTNSFCEIEERRRTGKGNKAIQTAGSERKYYCFMEKSSDLYEAFETAA